jgi:glutathione S-transferase
VLGSQFSAADVVFGGTLDFAVQSRWIEPPTARVAAYVRRIKDRPAYRQSHDPSWH